MVYVLSNRHNDGDCQLSHHQAGPLDIEKFSLTRGRECTLLNGLTCTVILEVALDWTLQGDGSRKFIHHPSFE